MIFFAAAAVGVVVVEFAPEYIDVMNNVNETTTRNRNYKINKRILNIDVMCAVASLVSKLEQHTIHYLSFM